MCQTMWPVLVTLLFAFGTTTGAEYSVVITNDGPVVLGATINFHAQLYKNGVIPEGNYKFAWSDNTFPEPKTALIETNMPNTQWNITYDPKKYPPGDYEVEVIVQERFMLTFYWVVTSSRQRFVMTHLLNGKLELKQGQVVQNSAFISSGSPIIHSVVLSPSDFGYLAHNATSIMTHWFIDCTYVGNSTNYTFIKQYKEPEMSHIIEALVVADFEPPPPPTTVPPPTTSTPKSTTTVKPTTTTTPKPTQAPPANVSTTTTTSKSIVKRDVTIEKPSPTNPPSNITKPFVCANWTIDSHDLAKTYGYFHRNITTKAPITNITITGNNWIQHAELFDIKVKCKGSPGFRYCIDYRIGQYNVTGNETCENPAPLAECEFESQHYFTEGDQHTVVLIIMNDVSKTVSPVMVTIYQAVHRAQLSVIVVPVVFSLVAVVLIVFGVAYFMQSSSRFTVEVADFDFGQQYAEMEYKTFHQRLRDSIISAFGGAPLITGESNNDVSPPSGFKYGSMT